MTTFKSAIYLCGLSQQGAATFLDVSLQSVKDWCRGRSAPPIGVWRAISDLFRRIEGAADHAATLLEPDMMDRAALNGVTADHGADPLPNGADMAAGAMSVLLAIQDIDA